jgi:hypothetical protein
MSAEKRRTVDSTYSGLGETTTVAVEALDLATSLVNIVDSLDGPKVVNSGVNTDLVETDQSSVLELLLQSLHLRVDVRSGDDVDLLLESDLHDGGVVSVRNEGDDDIVTLDGLSEGISGRDVNGHGGGVGELGSEGLGGGEGPASDGKLVVVLGDVVGSGRSNETGTKEKNLLLAGLGSVVVPKLGKDVDVVLEHGSTELGEGERGLVDVGVVVSTVGDGSERLGQVSSLGLGADSDTDLTRGVYQSAQLKKEVRAAYR